jgi:hypothetical protein
LAHRAFDHLVAWLTRTFTTMASRPNNPASKVPATRFAWALLQLNVGIDLGSAHHHRRRRHHFAVRFERLGSLSLWAICSSSIAAMAIGALWLVQRTAKVSLTPL